MLTIARMTVREAFNKKILYIVLVLTGIYLMVYGLGLNYTVKEITRWSGSQAGMQKALMLPQMLSLSLYFSTFIVALMTIFSTVNSISGEIETGTIQAVIPKPISRSSYISGKLFGYGTMNLIYTAALYFGLIMVTSWVGDYKIEGVFGGLLHFLFIPAVLTVLGVCGSVFLSTMANGVTMFMLFIIGTIGGMMEQIGSIIGNGALINIGILSSLLIPTDAAYRGMVFELIAGPNNMLDVFSMNPFAATNPPSGIMLGYAGLYIIIFAFLSLHGFNKKDM